MGLGYNGAKSKLVVVDLTDNTQVNSGSSNTQTLTPPAGKIYIIRNIYYYAAAPAGDTSGTHEIEALQTYVSAERRLFLVKGNHSTTVSIGTQFIGDSQEAPSSSADQMRLIKGDLIASNTYPINFDYNNDTDANQTGTRTLELLVEEFDEVK